jgi:cytidylate kinase
LAARERGIAWTDGPALGQLTAALRLSFATDADGAPRLEIDGVDCADAIRRPEISMGASDVSKHPQVRAALLDQQRQLGRDGGVVLEGRDIGTVVFPDAELKVFLTASAETRASRRVGDLAGRGVNADYAKTLTELQTRDTQDSTRPIAPLVPAPDSILMDTSALQLDDVVERLAALARARGA